MKHRPCGECRALVGPEGCEHWRPARKTLVIPPSQRELARRRQAESGTPSRTGRDYAAERRHAREDSAARIRRFMEESGLTWRPT